MKYGIRGAAYNISVFLFEIGLGEDIFQTFQSWIQLLMHKNIK